MWRLTLLTPVLGSHSPLKLAWERWRRTEMDVQSEDYKVWGDSWLYSAWGFTETGFSQRISRFSITYLKWGFSRGKSPWLASLAFWSFCINSYIWLQVIIIKSNYNLYYIVYNGCLTAMLILNAIGIVWVLFCHVINFIDPYMYFGICSMLFFLINPCSIILTTCCATMFFFFYLRRIL